MTRCGVFLVFSLLLFTSLPAMAQITSTARVELNDRQSQIFFGSQIYTTKDTDYKLTSKIVAARHKNNLRGLRQERALVHLGPAPAPTWITFSVTNNSAKEDWVLNFGDVFDGRLGHIRHVWVGNDTTQQILLRSSLDAERKMDMKPLKGAFLPLRIPKGETQLFVMYLDMGPSLAHTFKPSFMTYDLYIQRLMTGTWASNIFMLCMVGFAGFFAALSLSQKTAQYVYFSGYFLLYFLSYIFQEYVFYTGAGLVGTLSLIPFTFPVLAGFLCTRRFFDLTAEDESSWPLGYVVTMGIVLGFILSILLSESVSVIDENFFFLPLLFGTGVCGFTALVQAQNGKYGGIFMALAWALGFVGLLALFTGSLRSWDAGALLTNMYWFMLLPQGVFFILAAQKKMEGQRADEIARLLRQGREELSIERLRQSKETTDQARLLRIIERERELMAELREKEIERTEEMRRAKILADEANNAKSAFLAVVSHEIRTPMNGIIGMIRLLIDSKMTKQQTEYLQTMKKSGDTMMALLNDILDFEKIESGNMQLETIDFDMVKLVEGVVTLMSGHVAEKNITLEARISKDFPSVLRGDPTRIRQVLLNLVSNAIKFTVQGGVVIHLKATPMDKTFSGGVKADYEMYCAVEDTGIGISEESQKMLFQPFVQAEQSTTRKYGGTGLGLTICKRLIEAMGSTIQVKSEEGRGSTFSFTLWLEKGETDVSDDSGTADVQPSTDIVVPPLDILAIDDNDINRRVLKGFLENGAHRLVSCESAEEALKMCETQVFDIILTDIKLGGMSGIEFARALRQDPDPVKAGTPIIALSGNVSLEDQVQYKKAGMNGFLGKPLEPAALMNTLSLYCRAAVQQAAHNKVEEGGQEKTSLASFLDSQQEDDSGFDSFADAARARPEPKISGALDPALLKGVAEVLPKNQFEDLLHSFTEKTDELVSVLQDPSKNHDPDFLRDRAHELKGMAANFGLTELSAIAGKIENITKNPERDASQTAEGEIEKLSDANQRAKTELQQWLDSL